MLRSRKEKQQGMEVVILEQMVPENHLLRKIDRSIDFSFINKLCAPLYSENVGRPSVDPEILFRMLFVGYLYGIRSERRLEEEINYNFAYKWFCGLGLTEKAPDATTISVNRTRRLLYAKTPYAMRKFVGIDFFEEDAPDATTLLKFRRLLEKKNLNKAFFEAINRVMVESGHIMRGGTIVDATIINAPSSTKNAKKKRDPEMHQTKKGNEWRFGMKCHVGVDAGTGLVHTIEVTPANTHDITVASKLIRSDDEVVYGDSGFVGIQKRPEIKENEHLASIDYRIVRRPGSLPKVSDNAIDWERFIDHRKASIRCVKRQFGYAKTAYRGLQKNANRLYALFLSSNLYMLARAGRPLQKLEIA